MSEAHTTPLNSIANPRELTTEELRATLRATSWLLGDIMRPKIQDQLLLAKLSSLHVDLLAEEEDREKRILGTVGNHG